MTAHWNSIVSRVCPIDVLSTQKWVNKFTVSDTYSDNWSPRHLQYHFVHYKNESVFGHFGPIAAPCGYKITANFYILFVSGTLITKFNSDLWWMLIVWVVGDNWVRCRGTCDSGPLLVKLYWKCRFRPLSVKNITQSTSNLYVHLLCESLGMISLWIALFGPSGHPKNQLEWVSYGKINIFAEWHRTLNDDNMSYVVYIIHLLSQHFIKNYVVKAYIYIYIYIYTSFVKPDYWSRVDSLRSFNASPVCSNRFRLLLRY